MKELIATILAGGKGERLHPLTKDRSKPAVPFGGIYRLIDVTLSNCINSDIFKIMVFPQYRGQSLVDHIDAGWNIFSRQLGHFIRVVHAKMTGSDDMYKGTADALRHHLHMINQEHPYHVLVLSADHIYKMDYRTIQDYHLQNYAELSIAVREVDIKEAKRFGVLEVDQQYRVVGFEEKPKNPKCIPGKPEKALISMGIYLFNIKTLNESLEEIPGHDFGHDIIPELIKTARVFAYPYDKLNKIRDFVWIHKDDGSREKVLMNSVKDSYYWKDVGDLDALWQANMDLTGVTPDFSLYGEMWKLHTYHQPFPPVKTVFNSEKDKRIGTMLDSIVSPGSILSGGRVSNSVISYNVRVNSWAEVDHSVILSNVDIGRNCKLKKVIIDEDNRLPSDTIIGYDLEADAKRFKITDGGIVVVEKGYFS